MCDTYEVMLVVLRYIVAITFLLSAVPKLLDPKAFVAVVRSYGIVFDQIAWPVSIAVMISETAIAIGLICGILLGSTLSLALLLAAVFLILISIMLASGRQVECGCFFWDNGKLLSAYTLARALSLAIAVAVLWYCFWFTNAQLMAWGRDWELQAEVAIVAVLCWTLGSWVGTVLQLRKLLKL